MSEDPQERKFTAREIARARSLGERLQPDVFESVLQYGLYAQVRVAGLADEVMSRLDQSADERSDFVRLLGRMGRLDPGRRRRHPLLPFWPTFRRGPRNEDALLDRYDRLCHRLDRMLPALESAGRRIGETLARFDLLFERNQTYLEELDLLVYGARMRLETLQRRVAALRADEPKPTGPRLDGLQQLERQVERVEQRIVDLQAAADTARETGPTIRRIQDDLRTLLQQGQYTSLNKATRWKHRFAAAVTRARQLEARAAVRDGTAGGRKQANRIHDDEDSTATAWPHVALVRRLSDRARTSAAPRERRGIVGWLARARDLLRTRRAPGSRGDTREDVNMTDLWWG